MQRITFAASLLLAVILASCDLPQAQEQSGGGLAMFGMLASAPAGQVQRLTIVATKISGVLTERIAFLDFMMLFGKKYDTEEEKKKREGIFEIHITQIVIHNQEYKEGKHSYYEGVNEYSDMSDEEMDEKMKGNNVEEFWYEESFESHDGERTHHEEHHWEEETHHDEHDVGSRRGRRRKRQSFWERLFKRNESKKQTGSKPKGKASKPSDGYTPAGCVDWVKKGKVAPVKNQKQCGSCWAFATTGMFESYFAIQGKKAPVPLSDQQLIDCTHKRNSKYQNNGCTGGHTFKTFPFITENGGINTEKCYPYEEKDTLTCRTKPECTHDKKVPIGDMDYHQWASDAKMCEILEKQGPIAISFHASRNFNWYKGGILDDPMCNDSAKLNHAGTVVGFCKEGAKEYYVVKNSWGATWGEKGYFKIKRGDNHCGVGRYAVAIKNP